MLSPRSAAPETPSWGELWPEIPIRIAIDPNGNLTQKTENGEVWDYVWNAENQLIRVCMDLISPQTCDSDGVAVASFKYDPLGRRIKKVLTGKTYSYVLDGLEVGRETVDSGTNTTVLTYVHGPWTDDPLASEDGVGVRTYYHADGLGSVSTLTSAAGTALQSYRYDAWGDIELGASQPGPAFTGREWDPEIGLYYYRARYYDPDTGRFIGEDPIPTYGRTLREVNSYGYVANDPVNWRDPRGTDLQSAADESNRMTFLNPFNWYTSGVHEAMAIFPDVEGGPLRDRERHCLFTCLSLRRAGPLLNPWPTIEVGRKVIGGPAKVLLKKLGLVRRASLTDSWGDFKADFDGAVAWPQFWKTCEEQCRSCNGYPR